MHVNNDGARVRLVAGRNRLVVLCEDALMEDRQKRTLLRLYSGEAPEEICADLSITVEQLDEWARTTEPSALRPAGLPCVSTRLQTPE